MKQSRKNEWVMTLTCLLGALGCWLRHMILTEGIDPMGLLIMDYPCIPALWVLCLGYLAAAVLLGRGQKVTGAFRIHFPACRIRGTLGMAGGIATGMFAAAALLEGNLLTGISGMVAGICMIFTGRCRYQGRHPSPMFHVVVCVYFINHLIYSFQHWSADPQVQDYVIQLVACVALMMFAYHRAGFDANLPTPKRTVFFQLCAVFFGIVALSDENMWLFMIGAVLWSIGAGPTLIPVAQVQEPAPKVHWQSMEEIMEVEAPVEELTHEIPEAVREKAPEKTPEMTPEKAPEKTLEKAPEKTQDKPVSDPDQVLYAEPPMELYEEPDPKLIAELFARLPEEEKHPWR